MSKELTVSKIKDDIIMSVEKDFRIISSEEIVFEKELQFALQALSNNDFLMQTAIKNPQSLKSAIVNIAAVNLSLNPAERMAYLVPMNGAVQLMISYMGLAKLAVTDGGVKWLHSELVCEKDTFNYTGLGEKPEHKMNPFQERGAVVGVYATALTHDGSFLSRMMTKKECLDIRDRTQIWQKSKSGPWRDFENEMLKKTVVKNLAKTLPRTSGNVSRLDKAIEVSNEIEGIDFEHTKTNTKISQNSNLLNEKLGIKEPDQECKDIISSIQGMCKELCEGYSDEQKRIFLKTKLQLGHFKELNNKDRDFLIELEKYVLELMETKQPTTFTTEEIPWDGDKK